MSELTPAIYSGSLCLRRIPSSSAGHPSAPSSSIVRFIVERTRALEALDATPRGLDVRLVFPGVRGGVIDVENFRRAQWHPALEAAGLPSRRIYDLRHSFATWALDAGLSIFDLSRYMGTSQERAAAEKDGGNRGGSMPRGS